MTRRTVVFDVGGVLVDARYEVLALRLFDDDEGQAGYFMREVLGPEFHHERDIGVPMAESAAKWSARHPEYAPAIASFCARFPEMWVGPVPGTQQIVEELKQNGIGVFALTNWGLETWPLACEQFPDLRAFDGAVVSSEVGLVKPDPRIFGVLCERFDLAPDESVFIDDVATNVEAAEQLGFAGVVFSTAAALRVALAELGLL